MRKIRINTFRNLISNFQFFEHAFITYYKEFIHQIATTLGRTSYAGKHVSEFGSRSSLYLSFSETILLISIHPPSLNLTSEGILSHVILKEGVYMAEPSWKISYPF